MNPDITFVEGQTPEPARIDISKGFPRQSGMAYEELMKAKMAIIPLDTPVEDRIRQALLAKGKKA